jgi:ATP-dependent Clp protease ATP-binding subunit ClpA
MRELRPFFHEGGGILYSKIIPYLKDGVKYPGNQWPDMYSQRRFALNTFFTGASALERYGYNLTHLVQQEVLSPFIGYETYVTRIFQILLRQTSHKYNPLLLDPDEQRRFQVVTELVHRMAIGSAPDPLPTYQVISLNYEALFAPPSTSFLDSLSSASQLNEISQEVGLADSISGDGFPQPLFQQGSVSEVVLSRLQSFFLAVRQEERKIVLFIDHFYRLLGGDPQHYPVDALDLLVPALARREIQIIGGCTLAQYQEYIECIAALERRFQVVGIRLD